MQSAAANAAVLAAAKPTGEPMTVKTADIEEDAHRIRKRFKLDDMRASIRENVTAGRPPIKTPPIVKRIRPNRASDSFATVRSACARSTSKVSMRWRSTSMKILTNSRSFREGHFFFTYGFTFFRPVRGAAQVWGHGRIFPALVSISG